MSGASAGPRETVPARLAVQTVSERGRLEYLLVGLVRRDDGQLAAYPMGKGSGSVTAWSRADGFVRVGRNTEIVEVDAAVDVTLIGADHAVADLVVVGSHCAGLDRIASALAREGFAVKVQAVGSQGGLAAAQRGECDAAPMHLLDPGDGSLQRAVPRRRPAPAARLRADAGRRDARGRDARAGPRCSPTRRCAW